MNTHSALLTDQYQLVMAYGYWKLGIAENESVFHLTFRSNPFQGNYAIACGLENVIEYLSNFRFEKDDIEYLGTLTGKDNEPFFSADFLDYLSRLEFTCDVHAIPEGNLVFPNEPLLRIQGPILQCQLLETPLINLMSFPTLAATKASRLSRVTEDDHLIEFGLRRAQGPNGGITASRSAYIGGCTGTSNVLAGKKYDIPVVGTQAHSWIMAFPCELEAFKAFAKVMQDNTTLLVDTYDTLQGVENAIKVGRILHEKGQELNAIRLDSGNLYDLSIQARALLDDAGFNNTKIFASGDLDENIILDLKKNKAPIDAWGVGTRLSTCYDQPALNAIYKLGAIKENSHWSYKMKISNQRDKMTIPGIQQVRRYSKQQQFVSDLIYDVEMGLQELPPKDSDHHIDLLQPIFERGKLVYQSPDIHQIRDFCLAEIKNFSHYKSPYNVYIEQQLTELQKKLIAEINLKMMS